MNIVDKTDILNYAQRNTSPKMPIEQKYVYAFLDALLNSKSVQELYQILSDEMQNGTHSSYLILSGTLPET